MKPTLFAAIAAVALVPAAAFAQTATPSAAPSAAAATPTVGAKVFGPDGVEVGSVESVQNGVVTVNTGTARAGLPNSAFAMREKGLTIGMDKTQLEAAVNGAKAETSAAKDAALVADAPIKSSDGVVLGTVSKVEGDDVTVSLSTGATAMLKRSYLGLVNNDLTLGMTADAFNKQTQASAAAPAGADASAPATGEAAATTGPAAGDDQ